MKTVEKQVGKIRTTKWQTNANKRRTTNETKRWNNQETQEQIEKKWKTHEHTNETPTQNK